MKEMVLVTGADQHQGFAVIRGLGQAGIPVLAASAENRSIGFSSRFAADTALYTSPSLDPDRFVGDILDIVERKGVSMIIPAIESTLVALDAHRDLVPRSCRLAAPPSEMLASVVDKSKTVALAQRVGVPVPRTLVTGDVDEALREARHYRFPVALKPRGNPLHAHTRHSHGFKVKYARSWPELRELLQGFRDAGTLPLIQEYVRGTGVCVSTLFDRDRAVATVPYARLRETPLTGGISVIRETIPLEDRLREYTMRMLQALGWHGMAMVEFKHDRETDRYVLMEINGRFQASTALSLDAGVNFPELAYRLHAGLPLPQEAPRYRLGVRERWLRGDIEALLLHLGGITAAEAVAEARMALPGRARAVWNFLADFRRGTHFDEFKRDDPRPALMEAANCGRLLLKYAGKGLRRGIGMVGRGAHGGKTAVSEKS